ncbi:MAG: hypothetical protein HMLKMBBP_02642 [Planctomycetes bacterium]|nr:hypothetical protein [Planctomycetota bacterium]
MTKIPDQTGWGAVQEPAYHLERAVQKTLGIAVLAGADLIPQCRALLKEAGDWVVMAHKDLEALEVKGAKKKKAREAALKSLKAAEKSGVAAAALVFREKVGPKDVAEICDLVAAQVASEMAALRALIDLR